MNAIKLGRSRKQKNRRFPRTARLLRATDFERVFQRPFRVKDRYFTVLAVPAAQPSARLGLAVSRKRLKRAVDRNRIKRLIREVFRNRQETLQGVDLVVMSGSAVLEADARTLTESLDRQLDKIVARFGY